MNDPEWAMNEREQTGFRIEGTSSIIMMNEVITYLEEMGKLREQLKHQSGSLSRFFIIITIFDPIPPPKSSTGIGKP